MTLISTPTPSYLKPDQAQNIRPPAQTPKHQKCLGNQTGSRPWPIGGVLKPGMTDPIILTSALTKCGVAPYAPRTVTDSQRHP